MKALKAGVGSRARAGTSGSKVKKGRTRKGDGDTVKSQTTDTTVKNQTSNWGIFEPVHSILRPVVDLGRPLFGSSGMIVILIFLLITTWLRSSRIRNLGLSNSYESAVGFNRPQRIAAYEEIWRMEEEALWDWLETQVGIPAGYAYPATTKNNNADRSSKAKKARQQVLNGKGRTDKVGGYAPKLRKSMAEREVDWAVGSTEKKLKAFKDILREEKKGKGDGSTTVVDDDEDEEEEELSKEELAELEKFIKDEL